MGETLRALRAKGGRKDSRDFTSSARVTQPCRPHGITWRLSRKHLGGNLCKSQGFSLHVYVGERGARGAQEAVVWRREMGFPAVRD